MAALVVTRAIQHSSPEIERSLGVYLVMTCAHTLTHKAMDLSHMVSARGTTYFSIPDIVTNPSASLYGGYRSLSARPQTYFTARSELSLLAGVEVHVGMKHFGLEAHLAAAAASHRSTFPVLGETVANHGDCSCGLS